MSPELTDKAKETLLRAESSDNQKTLTDPSASEIEKSREVLSKTVTLDDQTPENTEMDKEQVDQTDVELMKKQKIAKGTRKHTKKAHSMAKKLDAICNRAQMNPIGVLNALGYSSAAKVPKKKWSGVISEARQMANA